MEDNNRNKGLFFGIIAIATLIVAIIGATFAYFSASVSTANDAVNFTSFDFSASISVEKIAPAGAIGNLIPVLENVVEQGETEESSTGTLVQLLNNVPNNGICIDAKGYASCVLYHITINNNSINALTLSGKLVTENGGNFQNLRAQFVTGTTGNYALAGDSIEIDETTDAKTTLTNPTSGSNGNFTVAAQTPGVGDGDPTPGTSEFYLVIYLNDTDSPQTNEMGQTFVGELEFESTTGTQGKLTAQITA